MSINNREDLNKYYAIINKHIDSYIDENGIRPSKLRQYLKNGSDKFEKFIDRNGLRDVNMINQVLNNVIDDRVSMEKDGILTFESFRLFESEDFKVSSIAQSLYKGIGKSDINTEKFIADLFDANLSDIDIVNSDRHIFRVRHWDSENIVIAYNKDEFDIIHNNIKEYLLNEVSATEIEVEGIKMSLEGILDYEKLDKELESSLDEEKVIELVTKFLKAGELSFKKSGDYYLWIA